MATEDDVRRLALSLPEVTEKPTYGWPGFRVKDKLFLRVRNEAEGGLVVFVEDLDEKEAMLASDPDVFFSTPHYEGHAMVLVHLEDVGLDELQELIVDSWRVKAPRRCSSGTRPSSPVRDRRRIALSCRAPAPRRSPSGSGTGSCRTTRSKSR